MRTCYDLHANCYLTKPVDLNQFADMVQTLERFWFNLVLLPPKEPDLLGAV